MDSNKFPPVMPPVIQIQLTPAEWKVFERLSHLSRKPVEDLVYDFFRLGFESQVKQLVEAIGPYAQSKLDESKKPQYPPGARDVPPHIKQQLDYKDSVLKDIREKEALDKLADLRKNCRHERTERFEDDAMYRCLSCGATGIVGSGRDPV
jgi:hypothetical protein